MYRLQDRIDWKMLARRGVFVSSTGHGRKICLHMELYNPTPANIAYIRRVYGRHVCVDRKPGGVAYACTGYEQDAVPEGPVVVPNLLDLGLREASKRALANNLRYSPACLGDAESRPAKVDRYSPEQLVRISRQCPAPGQRVPAGTPVVLEAEALLPGGFRYRIGALPSNGGCADGRNALNPGESE
jgi:hypothetical protein